MRFAAVERLAIQLFDRMAARLCKLSKHMQHSICKTLLGHMQICFKCDAHWTQSVYEGVDGEER